MGLENVIYRNRICKGYNAISMFCQCFLRCAQCFCDQKLCIIDSHPQFIEKVLILTATQVDSGSESGFVETILPRGVLLIVFSLLEPPTLLVAVQACKLWRNELQVIL